MNEAETKEGVFITHIHFPVEHKGQLWQLNIYPLETKGGITTTLALSQREQDTILMLDWHNILQNPQNVRLHIRIKEEAASLIEKRRKVQAISDAIQTYNSIMVNTPATLSETAAREILMQHNLPRVKIATLDTSYPVWRKRLSNLGFSQSTDSPHPFLAPWDKLISIIQDGKFK